MTQLSQRLQASIADIRTGPEQRKLWLELRKQCITTDLFPKIHFSFAFRTDMSIFAVFSDLVLVEFFNWIEYFTWILIELEYFTFDCIVNL